VLNGLGAKKKKEEKHRPDRIIFSEASSIAVKSIACQSVLLINANTSIPPGEQIRSEQLTALVSSLPHGLETANRSAPSLMLLLLLVHAIASGASPGREHLSPGMFTPMSNHFDLTTSMVACNNSSHATKS